MPLTHIYMTDILLILRTNGGKSILHFTTIIHTKYNYIYTVLLLWLLVFFRYDPYIYGHVSVFLYYRMSPYSWNTAKVGVFHQPTIQSIYKG
jgi:hypothetical protein